MPSALRAIAVTVIAVAVLTIVSITVAAWVIIAVIGLLLRIAWITARPLP